MTADRVAVYGAPANTARVREGGHGPRQARGDLRAYRVRGVGSSDASEWFS